MPSTSKAQQKFMGLVHAYKKGEVKASEVSKAIKKAAKSMKKSSTKKYASTKHKGLPNKVKEEGFGGDLKGEDKKRFEKARKANGEQLGYKLSGTPDVKEERDYKEEYKKYGSSTKAKKYRAELNQYNRKKGTYGNGDGKDASHKGGKIVGFESQSKNRGRAEKSRLKKETVNEDGHTDVASIERKLKIIIRDSVDTIKKLRSMSNEDSLPSWWTDKITLAKDYVSKSRDYIMNPAESVNEGKFNPNKIKIHTNKAIGYLKQAQKFAKEGQKGAVWQRIGDARDELKMTDKFLESVNESIQLPHGMELGKVFTGHGKSFVKEESVNEDVGAETILGGIVQSIQKAGLKPKSAKLMKSGFKVSKRDKVGFVIDVEIRGFDKKEIHKMQFEVERGMLYLILNNKPVKLGKWTMGTMVTKNLKKIALTLSGQKGSPKRIA